MHAKRKAAPKGHKTKPHSPISRLKPFLLKRKAALVGSIATGVVATLMGLIPYWVIYRICTGLTDGGLLGDKAQLLVLAGTALFAIVLKGLLTALSTNWTHRVAYDVVYEVRMALADKLAKLPLGYFDRTDSGKIKHTLNEDVEQLEEGIAHLLPDITASTALPILSFAIMFTMDWRMGLAVLAFIGVTVGGYALVMTYLKPLQAGYGKAGAAVSSAILTYVYGMKVIRAFSSTELAFESYSKAVREFSDTSSLIESKGMPAKTAAVLLSRTALLIVIPSGIWLITREQLTIPVLIFFILMSLGVGAALFKMLRSSGMTAFRLAASLKNVGKMLEEQEMASAGRPQIPKDATIRLQHVTFAYNKQAVLSDISLEIPAGTMTALVGPSGAGKTTIARLLPRFWDTDGGSVIIGGVDVREMSEEQLMSLVSFVFQDAYLFQGTVMDNIRFGKPAATEEEVMAAARRAGCHTFIEQLPQGYHTAVGEGGMTLSGGQRQRISLVRAILKDAPIIILDEATALVDPENEARILDALAGLLHPAEGEPKTIVAIAHRLGTVVHADQIAVIDEGRVAAVGTHGELLQSSELYHRLWEAYEAGTEDLEEEELVPGPVIALEAPAPDLTLRAQAGVQMAKDSQTFGKLGVSTSAPDNPHRHLDGMSELQQSLLLAGDKANRLRGALVFAFFENVFTALGSIAVVAVLYKLLADRPDEAWAAAGWMALMFAGQSVFYFLTNKWSFPLFGHFLTHIRLYLGDRLRKVPYGFFLQKDASVLESRVKTDAGSYIYVPSIVIGLIKACVIPPLILMAMLWMDWRLALVSLAGVPLSVVSAWLAERKLKEIMQKLSAARQAANSRILEYIRGIAVIRSFGLTGSRMQSYEETIRKYRDASISINRKLTPYTAVYHISFELGLALVLIVGGLFVAQGTLAPANFMVFLVLAICFYEPLPLMDYALFKRMFATTVHHMNDIILAEEMPLLPSERRPMQGAEIAFRDVTFSYGDKPVLNGLNLVIPEKGTTALVGPSGGGKTTMLHLIARFWDVQQGAVMIGGADVRGMSSDELMRQLAFVFQDVYLFNDTVTNNIRYGNPDASMEQVEEAARKARCHDFIIKLPDGYDTVVGEGGGLLSGGQRQRISIARAILKDAPIILLDEATASVDPDNERYIQEAFEEMARDKTVVIIAHRLHTVRRADHIVVIDDGRVVQSGTHKGLLTNGGIYRRFWEERRRAQGWLLRRTNEEVNL
ncbi:ABC transporter ATP-binding protein [Paenibacillus eucommiae]|uniref:ABC-type multidrug transport system fused ATPase/permease subunit n=1 Tax=Paenibacillus eucommiae TaxID=1355755 RepID=A0ABS4JAP5_9BACL|nr:ABC transporter ATP-binding protein [Paenibacillus eucommiae]MBP1996919.1 ABC-type multidrug transport system fused ATPase/permease subunit [Paenibacillus eucommiae]